ncbi:hypothetical protein COK37_30975 [Bacillus thuringiensis]|uniref:Uncharacterized protein n=5 Tax=Bacillus TaxID=1386 RepID=A0A9X6SX28_BACCE|nr:MULTISPECIES: hypothetical protein [Bacillus]EKS7875618.1 hypothetical protein [Bacillus cereus]EKS8378353.1 hypothetical protein [Bacillus cereus]EKS8383839.1 hypothetical protein [Bacillus cereus]KAA1803907.1 hypothetical protein FXB61_005333 [Bacillus cereus]MBN9901145.1 hypothetical protein [Bacillus thuringiensis]
MFKKLMIGVLATGFILTGGIGVASADVADNPVCNKIYYVGNDGEDLYSTHLCHRDGIYANYFNDGKYNWYYKGTINGMGWYQGRLAK